MTVTGENLSSDASRKGLRAAKRNATILLCLPVSVFTAALFLDPGIVQDCLRSTGEAGTVGGLADWFAVVALFRKPLGLPIPHTALIPAKKDALGVAIGRFVEKNLVAPADILAELRKEDRAVQLGNFLSSPQGSLLLAESIAGSLQAAGRNGMHLDVVGATLPAVKRLQKGFHADIASAIAKITGPVIPSFVDRYFTSLIETEINRLLGQIENPESFERKALDAWVRVKLERMPVEWQGAAIVFAKEVNKLELISQLGTGEPSQELIDSLSSLISQIGRSIIQSNEFCRSINSTCENVLVQYLAPFGSQISMYISGVVQNWSAEKIADAIELQVGKDLQFIRINGTVVGMIMGAALFGVERVIVTLRTIGFRYH